MKKETIFLLDKVTGVLETVWLAQIFGNLGLILC